MFFFLIITQARDDEAGTFRKKQERRESRPQKSTENEKVGDRIGFALLTAAKDLRQNTLRQRLSYDRESKNFFII